MENNGALDVAVVRVRWMPVAREPERGISIRPGWTTLALPAHPGWQQQILVQYAWTRHHHHAANATRRCPIAKWSITAITSVAGSTSLTQILLWINLYAKQDFSAQEMPFQKMFPTVPGRYRRRRPMSDDNNNRLRSCILRGTEQQQQQWATNSSSRLMIRNNYFA